MKHREKVDALQALERCRTRLQAVMNGHEFGTFPRRLLSQARDDTLPVYVQLLGEVRDARVKR